MELGYGHQVNNENLKHDQNVCSSNFLLGETMDFTYWGSTYPNDIDTFPSVLHYFKASEHYFYWFNTSTGQKFPFICEA